MASGDPSGLSCEEERIAVLFSYQATEWVERSEAFLLVGRMMRKTRSLLFCRSEMPNNPRVGVLLSLRSTRRELWAFSSGGRIRKMRRSFLVGRRCRINRGLGGSCRSEAREERSSREESSAPFLSGRR